MLRGCKRERSGVACMLCVDPIDILTLQSILQARFDS